MSAWERVLETLAEEFADLEDPARATRVVLRLFLAALLGGLLGFEREQHGKAAGVRTHMLVALGAALFVLVPQMAGAEHDAMSRVIQGLTAGIGFLCAGTILKRDRMDEVKGLTTAAGLWSTTAIGVTVGLGYEATALLAALVVLAILNLLPHLLGRFDRPQR
ncbi:MgtC/SapB family protein [Metapseudomonas otitidis]|uniref:Protein MgtC n=1 Tax=Metapseudomonas otitidis TaxID=319939 RepID=A0A6S5RQM9_9GAMM|nr:MULTISPECIES: MgtC/SapB family protein [Pseudomonas]MDL5597330.1 MgtC/SapB family protein [Bacillus subtilis]KIV72381.1 Mg(2+) transport ATPase protein C [Pseudomonas sp. FeS53a]MBO2927831.1 MgtC/SapB family protein [Pseudomonas otitidis]MCO7558020.1 MgtC/SapB family protein [Pseudomonas otitidis]MDH0335615.1 MgtC/SapB family protein [Pseudomonas otitidis]